jgi:prepilin-type N-terminal cleavage/methylation domain-containing protein
MRRKGFTLIEMLLVIVIMGVAAVFAVRPMRAAQQSARVRAAKVIGASYIVNARSTAINRGCRATIHFTQGDSSLAWLTSCKLTASGAVSPMTDTVGTIDKMGSRLGVRLTSTSDSIQYDAQGLAINGATTTFKYSKGSPASVDSFVVNTLGMVIQ